LFKTCIVILLINQVNAELGPRCMIGIHHKSLTIPCGLDGDTVSWQCKTLNRKFDVYLDGKPNYFQNFSISGLNTTEKGQYDLVFDSLEITSANRYTCKDYNGMNQVTDLIVVKPPIKCSYTNHSTSLNVMVCYLTYVSYSDTDKFLWYYNNTLLKDYNVAHGYKTNLVSKTQLTIIYSYYDVPSEYTLYSYKFGYKFLVKFRDSDECTWEWIYGHPERDSLSESTVYESTVYEVTTFEPSSKDSVSEQPIPGYTAKSKSSSKYTFSSYNILKLGICMTIFVMALCTILFLLSGCVQNIQTINQNNSFGVKYTRFP